MSSLTRFPLKLDSVFFRLIHFSRDQEVPESPGLNLHVTINAETKHLPDILQIFVKLQTPEGQPINLSIELVSLFSRVEGEGEPDQSLIFEFVKEKALFMLWPHVIQLIRDLTLRMGIAPMNLDMPHHFDIKRLEEIAASSEGTEGD